MAWLSPRSGRVSYPQEQYDRYRQEVIRLRLLSKSMAWRSIIKEVDVVSQETWSATAPRFAAMISQFGLYGEFPSSDCW
jgi:hypothetical protein